MYTITEIEDAIIQALQDSEHLSMVPDTRIKSFGQAPEIADFEQYCKGFPSLLVVYAGGDPERGDSGNCAEIMQFMVFAGGKSLRGAGASRKDEDAGAYALIDGIKRTLQGNGLGLGMLALEYAGTEPHHATAAVAIYSVTFVCEVILYSEAQ